MSGAHSAQDTSSKFKIFYFPPTRPALGSGWAPSKSLPNRQTIRRKREDYNSLRLRGEDLKKRSRRTEQGS